MKKRRKLRSLRKREREVFKATLSLMGFRLSKTFGYNSNINLYLSKDMRILVGSKYANLYAFKRHTHKRTSGITINFNINSLISYINKHE